MAIEDYIFPMHSLGSKAAASGALGLGPMGFGDSGLSQNQLLLGLLGPSILGMQGQVDPAQREAELAAMMPEQFLTGGEAPVEPNAFASQTPGAPGMPNRGSQQVNPLDLLSQNIAKRFGR